MANKGNFLQSHKGQVVLNTIYSLGAAVVILGALFKLQHWPFANFFLILGLGTEVFIFAIQSFAPPKPELDWAKVYPELENELGDGGDGARSVTQKLDNMLEEANIEKSILDRLGNNLGKLSDNVSKMGEIGDAVGATSEYASSARAAANVLGEMKDAYSSAASSAQGLSTSVDGLSDALGALDQIREDTVQVRQQMATLSDNLASLNQVYGNMLSAMRPQG